MGADRQSAHADPARKRRDGGEHARLSVRVTPRSSRNELIGYDGTVAQVRVSAPPVDSAANEACVALIAEILDVRRSQVAIVGGAHNRSKVIEVQGLSPGALDAKLRAAVGS